MSAALSTTPSLEAQIAAEMEQMIAFHEIVQAGGKPEETLKAAFQEQLQEVQGVAVELFSALATRQQQVAAREIDMKQEVAQAANLNLHAQQLTVVQQANASFLETQKKLQANLVALRKQIQERTQNVAWLQQRLKLVQLSGKTGQLPHERELYTLAAAASRKAAQTSTK